GAAGHVHGYRRVPLWSLSGDHLHGRRPPGLYDRRDGFRQADLRIGPQRHRCSSQGHGDVGRPRERGPDQGRLIPMRRTLLLIVAVLVPASAHAQGSVTDVLGFLMTNQAVPTADFERDRAAAEASRDVLSRALLVNLTSAPLTTSSGGFLYRLN